MITACLVSWRRTYHLREICENLLSFPEITEILIFQNESPEGFPELPKGVEVMHSDKNMFVLGRYFAASLAVNQTVFFQDDDLLVNNIPELLERFEANGRTKVVANLADDKSSKHWTWWQVHSPEWVEVGFGAIASKAMVKKLGFWPFEVELLRRKADKIFTIINEWEAVYAGPETISRLFRMGKESGRDGNSLSIREDHERLTGEAVKLALEWKSNPKYRR